MDDYTLLDSGNERKWEKFGPYTLIRPAAQAVWQPQKIGEEWDLADAIFTREKMSGRDGWRWKGKPQELWQVTLEGIKFHLSPTGFGHLGLFPEHQMAWRWMKGLIAKRKEQKKTVRVLNLFAYSGGATLAAAQAGAEVCHLDASKGMVQWARDNASLNGLEKAPIRWIVEDARKFLRREINRGKKYEGILLDPPSFGRGSKGEVFKVEEEINSLLQMCRQLLSPDPLFLMYSSHTLPFTPLVLQNFFSQTLRKLPGLIESGELIIPGQEGALPLPSGTYARWSCDS